MPSPFNPVTVGPVTYTTLDTPRANGALGKFLARQVAFDQGRRVYAAICCQSVIANQGTGIAYSLARQVAFDQGRRVYAVSGCSSFQPELGLARQVAFDQGRRVYAMACCPGQSSPSSSSSSSTTTSCSCCPPGISIPSTLHLTMTNSANCAALGQATTKLNLTATTNPLCSCYWTSKTSILCPGFYINPHSDMPPSNIIPGCTSFSPNCNDQKLSTLECYTCDLTQASASLNQTIANDVNLGLITQQQGNQVSNLAGPALEALIPLATQTNNLAIANIQSNINALQNIIPQVNNNIPSLQQSLNILPLSNTSTLIGSALNTAQNLITTIQTLIIPKITFFLFCCLDADPCAPSLCQGATPSTWILTITINSPLICDGFTLSATSVSCNPLVLEFELKNDFDWFCLCCGPDLTPPDTTNLIFTITP